MFQLRQFRVSQMYQRWFSAMFLFLLCQKSPLAANFQQSERNLLQVWYSDPLLFSFVGINFWLILFLTTRDEFWCVFEGYFGDMNFHHGQHMILSKDFNEDDSTLVKENSARKSFWINLQPKNILQHLYIKKRISQPGKSFISISSPENLLIQFWAQKIFKINFEPRKSLSLIQSPENLLHDFLA